jgi:hypothetical protein
VIPAVPTSRDSCDGYDCDCPLPLTPDQFRALFTAFTDPTTYPDAMIQGWLDLAPLDPYIWGARYPLGQGLWTAHELAKYGPGGLAATGGASGIGGIMQSKSVGPVSVSYDTGIGTEGELAGQYNLTIYGRQFWSMAKLLGIGAPIQLGAATPPPPGTGAGWIGPPPWPWPGGSGFSS